MDRLKWRCSLARICCGILKVAAGTSGIVALSFPPVAPIFGSICTQAGVGAAAFGATVTVFEQMSRSEQVGHWVSFHQLLNKITDLLTWRDSFLLS